MILHGKIVGYCWDIGPRIIFLFIIFRNEEFFKGSNNLKKMSNIFFTFFTQNHVN
jgi:hypothetical protein